MNSDMMATLNDPILRCPAPPPMAMDPRWRANIYPAPNCPRCASSNTKFCYYNNYSLSQPRFFCKGCRRYWTRGGSLRNVPVGGGCRRTRRSRSKALAGSGSGCSSNPSSNSSSESYHDSHAAPADIDMAAVFARFLSNGQSNNNINEQEINEVTTRNTTPETSHDSFTSTSVVFDQDHEFRIDELVSSDFADFDGGIVDGVFWSDHDLTWQQLPQLQELDSPLLPVDHSLISNNSVNSISYDDWNGLENMVYEDFPRH